ATGHQHHSRPFEKIAKYVFLGVAKPGARHRSVCNVTAPATRRVAPTLLGHRSPHGIEQVDLLRVRRTRKGHQRNSKHGESSETDHCCHPPTPGYNPPRPPAFFRWRVGLSEGPQPWQVKSQLRSRGEGSIREQTSFDWRCLRQPFKRP